MSRKQLRDALLSRRVMILGGMKVLASTALVSRLYYLQFIQADSLRIKAEDNRINLQLIPPKRGQMLDCNSQPLAQNERYFKVSLERGVWESSAQTLHFIQQRLSVPEDVAQKQKIAFKRTWRGRMMLVKEHLTWDEMVMLEFYTAELPGMHIDTGQLRSYPLKENAAHVLGYVGIPTERDITPSKPLLQVPGFKIGKNGLELQYEQHMQGVAGIRHMEVNALGLPVRELKRTPPEHGTPLLLTLDARLQNYCCERLAGQSGSAVVMDIHTGDVLALATVPAYDPNRFSEGIKTNYWNSLMQDEKTPLVNKAIAGMYPPGSTFKMIVALAALEQGIATKDTHVYCPGHFFLGSHRFNCWKPEGHGRVNAVDALAKSCDTYFYTMAQKLGIEPIAAMARRYGLGAPTGIDLPNEKGGLVPSPQWKRATYNDGWRTGDTVNVGIGQGYILATPLQLAVMAARLSNGGKAVVPHLAKHLSKQDPPLMEQNPEHAALICEGMVAVVNEWRGTAIYSKLPLEGFRMAGKTGTSQVRRITKRGQDQNTLPWRERHHALFVAYAPVENPRYSVSVVIEHGGGGSSAAAPVARDIVMKLHEYYYAHASGNPIKAVE